MKDVKVKKRKFYLLLSSVLFLTFTFGYKTLAAESTVMEGNTPFGIGFTSIKDPDPTLREPTPITR